MNGKKGRDAITRRTAATGTFAGLGLAAFDSPAQEIASKNAPVAARDKLRITKLETFLVKPRWLFLKVHTNAGITGLGEPITEGRALTCATAVQE